MDTTTTTPGHDGDRDYACAPCRLYELAEHHGANGDWSEVRALADDLDKRLNKGDRRTVRAQAMRDEINTIVRGAFPGRDDGLILVVNFQARFFQRRWIGLPRRWPLVGESVQARAVFTYDDSDGCLWSRHWPRNKALTPAQVKRLDRLSRRLGRQGVFDDRLAHGCASPGANFSWAREEPDAFPGLDRLVLTINPHPLRGGDPARPNPDRPLDALHAFADAYIRARTAEDFVNELGILFRLLLGWSLARPSFAAGQTAALAPGAKDTSLPRTPTDGESPF